ncbi:PH domain-containing rcdII [Galdieria sulphuraria]|uniref:Coiled-coil domain-containing protein 6 n=1 Tax=Galdieria sulphuraria TaxID=130081 RepID=M2XAN8_GALSU|nr:coiled-coil domain-containing protein 6 [Galdieria sulphuraria]EME26942.1 coiled-coil domain-containing protein 6 [Galdieria sulphuraria]GJD10590.1 PH domain-containing rcdII [Galdieria sulphuraria]|eukprot:XP_005703462.1 coiled-coil domain-containing protein 6 [Galdieria sulphuraria]
MSYLLGDSEQDLQAKKPSYEELLNELSQLKAELFAEKHKRKVVEQELKEMKQLSFSMQTHIEAEEEYIANKLIKRLTELKEEKERLAVQIEQEEEYLTNNLQQKLEQLRREKVNIENQLEQEQEFIVNRLQRQLDELRVEKQQLEKKIEELSRQATPSVTPTRCYSSVRDSDECSHLSLSPTLSQVRQRLESNVEKKSETVSSTE